MEKMKKFLLVMLLASLLLAACGAASVEYVPPPENPPPPCELNVWGNLQLNGQVLSYLLYQDQVDSVWVWDSYNGHHWGYYSSDEQRAEAEARVEEFRMRADVFRRALNGMVGMHDDLGGVTFFQETYYPIGYWEIVLREDCDPNDPDQYGIWLSIPDKSQLIGEDATYIQSTLDYVTTLRMGEELAVLEVLGPEMALGQGNRSFLTIELKALWIQAIFEAAFNSEGDPQTAFEIVRGIKDGQDTTVVGSQAVIDSTSLTLEQFNAFSSGAMTLATFAITEGDQGAPNQFPKILEEVVSLHSGDCDGGKSEVVIVGHHEPYGEVTGSSQTEFTSYTSFDSGFFGIGAYGFSFTRLTQDVSVVGYQTQLTFGEVYFKCDELGK